MRAMVGRMIHYLSIPMQRLVLSDTRRTRVLIIRGKEVLLIKDWISQQRWRMPGGGIHKNEERIPAARREIKEELRIDIPENKLHHVLDIQVERVGITYTAVCFTAHIKKGQEPHIRQPEILAAQWFPIDKLPKNRHWLVDKIMKEAHLK